MPKEMAMLHPVDGTPDAKAPLKQVTGEAKHDRPQPPEGGAEPDSKAEDMMAFLAERQRRDHPQR